MLQHTIDRFRSVLLLLALFVGVNAFASHWTEAHAAVVCSVDTAEIDFGSATTAVGAIDYTCSHDTNGNSNFTICVDVGIPSFPGTVAQPVLVRGTDQLLFNLYQDPALNVTWAAGQPLTQAVSISGGVGRSVSGSIPVYGSLIPNQSIPPGIYQASFDNTVLGFALGQSGQCAVSQGNRDGQLFSINVTASVDNACRITSVADANLGSIGSGTGLASGVADLLVNCPVGTAFTIGLAPSNGNTQGIGQLVGGPTNGDRPQYELRSGSATGPLWGDTATMGFAGNGVAAVGTGADQGFPIYVLIPDTNVAPDTYRDTVRVTVHF